MRRIVAAFGYLRDADGRLLMVANEYAPQGRMWGVPGGGREEGESLEVCLAREFAEEVGLEIGVGRKVCIIARVKPAWNLDLEAHFFEVERLGGAERIDPDEEHVVDWRYRSAEEIERLDEPVLGRAYLAAYLRAPQAVPARIVMSPEEE